MRVGNSKFGSRMADAKKTLSEKFLIICFTKRLVFRRDPCFCFLPHYRVNDSPICYSRVVSRVLVWLLFGAFKTPAPIFSNGRERARSQTSSTQD